MRSANRKKIDIISYDTDIKNFIVNALSPAEIAKVEIEDSESKRAKIFVDESQQSIAIGRGGQNVRLASKLTGYELDITPNTQAAPVPKTEKKPRKNIEDELFSAIEESNE